MFGLIMSIIAGAAMSFQGVINTRLSEKVGLYESNVFAQGIAFLLGLIVMWFLGKGDITQITQVSKIYWLGGILGVIITITVMLAIGNLSPTHAIAIILISQLFTAAVIDALALLGTEKTPFYWTKWIGLGLMVAGVIVFQWKKIK